MNELIATSYQFRAEFERRETMPVTFNRMRSPFYAGEKWSVRRGASCLTKNGEWIYEPIPSSRGADFYSLCRFDSLAEAVGATRDSATD